MIAIAIFNSFRRAIVQAAEIITNGEIHRFASNSDCDDDAGCFDFHGHVVPAGEFGCFRSDIRQIWCRKSDRQMTTAESDEYGGRIEAARDRVKQKNAAARPTE
jgi:hypothetical protein